MAALKSVVDFIVGLGSTVMLPILIFLLMLVLRQRLTRAVRSALIIGVGFVGLGLVINLLMSSLGPATNALIQRTGLHLTAVDVGWGVSAAIAFGTTVGAIIVPLAFGVNIVMLLLRATRTLNVDMWNFWHYAFTGSLVYGVTHNLGLGIAAAVVHNVYSLWIADRTAPRVQEFFGIPGISIPQGWAVTSVPVVLGLDWLFDRIPGLRGLNADAETIQRRLGLLGDPLILGAILGLLMGFGAGYDVTKTLQLAVSLGAVMFLVPRIIAIFMEGLTDVSEAAREYLSRRFAGREFYIGLDSAIMIGHPITIAAGILLIPTVLLLAAILPGNRTLPFGDLAATAFFVAFATPLMRGNLVRVFLAGAVMMVVVLYVDSSFAPLLTQTAREIGYKIPENAAMITSLSGGNWVAWVLVQLGRLLG